MVEADGGNCLQRLLKEKCMSDEKLFGSFLNRLFNTLNWTITEFSVAIKEMQEHSDLRQVGVCCMSRVCYKLVLA